MPELNTNLLAVLLASVYPRVAKRRRIAALILGTIVRLEGGPMHSATARRLLDLHHGVRVGAFSYGPCMHVGGFPEGVEVGRYVSIAPGVKVFPRNHPIDAFSTHPLFYEGAHATARIEPGTLHIGHDVWIGANAIITAGCRRIGTGAVVGAGSVVTSDVRPYTIVAGNPARELRPRLDPRVSAALAASRWWELPPELATSAARRAIELAPIPHPTHSLAEAR